MRGRADRGLEPRDEALPRRSEALDGDAGDEQIRALRRCARNRRKLCSRSVAGGKRQCAAARASTCGTEIRGGAAREHASEVRRVGAPARHHVQADTRRRARERGAILVPALRAVRERRDGPSSELPQEAGRGAQPRDLPAVGAREICRGVQRRDEHDAGGAENRQLGARTAGVERADHRDDLAVAHRSVRICSAAFRAPRPGRARVVAHDVADAEAAGAEIVVLQRQLDRLGHLVHRRVRAVLEWKVGDDEQLRAPGPLVVEALATSDHDGLPADHALCGARQSREHEGDDDDPEPRHRR